MQIFPYQIPPRQDNACPQAFQSSDMQLQTLAHVSSTSEYKCLIPQTMLPKSTHARINPLSYRIMYFIHHSEMKTQGSLLSHDEMMLP